MLLLIEKTKVKIILKKNPYLYSLLGKEGI